MALSNAICPKCNRVNPVDATKETWVCEKCGTNFITKNAMEAWDRAFVLTINRNHHPVIRNDYTFSVVYKGNYSAVADSGSISLLISERELEIPVLITDNEGTEFEALLIGKSEGKDMELTWEPRSGVKELGCIVSASNPTLRFVEMPGIARAQKLHQEDA